MEITQYVLPGEAVFPEGITAAPDGVTFYVSSARQGTIFRGRIDRAEAEVWQPAGADGRTQALGMAVDGLGRIVVCGWRTGQVFVYDTGAGDLVAKRGVPVDSTGLNDVCVFDGHAYVTDSGSPLLWRFALSEVDRAGVGEAELWTDLSTYGASTEPFTDYLNGIVPTPDGSALIVAAQGSGVLWRVDLTDGAAERIETDVPICGDGLAFVGDVLYACDNSEEPDGSVRMWLSAVRLGPDYRTGRLAGRWERPLADTPTTLTHLDGRLYLVNSQFVPDRDGRAAAPFTVSAVPVPL